MGADISAQDKYGMIALHQARVLAGSERTIKLLVENGADLSFRDSAGWAAHIGCEPQIKLLMDKGSDVTAPLNSNREIPLHLVAYQCVMFFSPTSYFKYKSIVELLAERAGNLSAPGNFGWTVLHRAAYQGSAELVQVLLDKGVDITIPNNGGKPLLKLAESNRETRVLRILGEALHNRREA